jgi:23S rRNA A2030 N6-methylase RlmJ
VLVINPPWGFVPQMQAALPALAALLAPGSGQGQVDWLVPE